MVMTAYNNDPAIKASYVERMRAHATADEIIKGTYWEDGKGCFVGCTTHGYDHAAFDGILGPGGQMVAHIADVIFEGATNERSKMFAVEFHDVIRCGADLSRVQWQFLHWILTDDAVNPRITDFIVAGAVAERAAVVAAPACGEPINPCAARSARIARIAESAADSAYHAAERAAAAAACAAETAAAAAGRAARIPAWIAAESAYHAAESAGAAAYDMMADKLIELLAAA